MKKPFQFLKIIFPIFFLFVTASWAGEAVQLRILYFNDFHGFAEPHQPVKSPEKIGGIAFLAGEVNRLRSERPALLVAAGDLIQGNPWANLFEGKSAIQVLNAMGLTAMVLGNHEFDFGQEVLRQRITEARFPVLAANVQGVPGLKSYIIKEIGGIKVAIIGLVTEDTPIATHPKNVEGLTFSPVSQTASRILQELGDQCDLVLFLSHLGLSEDRRLAGEVPRIQVIVGGHSHTRIETPIEIGNTLIVQAWEHAKVLGVLDLTIQDRKVIGYEGKLIPIDPSQQKPDRTIAEIVDHYKNQSLARLEEVIGTALVDLQGAGSRSRETTMGNLITDIIRQDTKAEVVLMNGGGLRADILKGPIRMKDLLSVLPFSTHLVVVRVTGQELKAILEHGLSNLSGDGGQFPQISGVRMEYQSQAPVGERIKGLWVQDMPWKPESWYTLATNDYLIAGGDGYVIFKKIVQEEKSDPAKASRVLLFDSGRELREVVIRFIKEKKQISALIEHRIRKLE